MRLTRLLAGGALLLCATHLAAQPQELHRYISNAVSRSTYIFSATVLRSHDSTVAAAAITNRTLVVRVEREFVRPEQMPSYAGREITLQAKDEPPASKRAIFFTTGWLIGESVAVREVGRLTGVSDDDAARLIDQAAISFSESVFEGQIRAAGAIVHGTVGSVSSYEGGKRPMSEHDPQWRKAELVVKEVLKAPAGRKPSRVLFPGSHDVMWVDSPRLREGDAGIFLLHYRRELGEYVVTDKKDVVSEKELDRVKAAIRKAERITHK